MIKIKVRLYGGLQPTGTESGKKISVELPEGATMRNLIELLKIPRNLTFLFIVNNLEKEIDVELKGGDIIDIFPPLAGG